eukprot:COSAG01_NODE_2_length_63927_cov_1357.611941_13_plen_148_part_00
MFKQKKLTDPLSDIDPIMEQAFLDQEDGDLPGIDAVDQGEPVIDTPSEQRVSKVKFPDLEQSQTSNNLDQDLFNDIKVNVSVQLGRAQLNLKDLLHLKEGAIVEMDRLVGEPIDLVVNNQVVAKGEVVAVNQFYGFRVTQILAKKEA